MDPSPVFRRSKGKRYSAKSWTAWTTPRPSHRPMEPPIWNGWFDVDDFFYNYGPLIACCLWSARQSLWSWLSSLGWRTTSTGTCLQSFPSRSRGTWSSCEKSYKGLGTETFRGLWKLFPSVPLSVNTSATANVISLQISLPAVSWNKAGSEDSI